MNELSLVLSPEEAEIVEAKLYGLLERQVSLYTGGDSSSVPEARARQLLESLVFTLSKATKSPQELLTGDLAELLKKGQKRLAFDLNMARSLWQTACSELPKTGSISLRDTLKEIGGFFRRYDLRYAAQDIPCDIDYHLCLPVSEAAQGVDYIAEYLRRIITENRFLAHFPQEAAERLLEAVRPGYRQLLVNLCEPIFTNAVGLALLEKPAQRLNITDSDRESIAAIFEPLTPSQAKERLCAANSDLCKLLSITDVYSEDYFAEIAEGLYPRIETALRHGGLEGVFVSF